MKHICQWNLKLIDDTACRPHLFPVSVESRIYATENGGSLLRNSCCALSIKGETEVQVRIRRIRIFTAKSVGFRIIQLVTVIKQSNLTCG
jgi:hypothetical protein